MSITRIYQSINLCSGMSVQLGDQASHHVARVLRAVIGDQLILFNGAGDEYLSVITAMMKKHVIVDIRSRLSRIVESPIAIDLVQGIARGEKMDFIVQKATELGVKRIIPLITERCGVRLIEERGQKRLQHWQSVAVSACEQSGRHHLPEIMVPMAFKGWLTQVKVKHGLVLSPQLSGKLASTVSSAYSSVMLLIGPEGGLSTQEVTMAMKQGFKPLCLGPRILRTETATVAAISILQHRYGDMC
jgi:16S rRNA (uracil1498-N3)-methyltransferase